MLTMSAYRIDERAYLNPRIDEGTHVHKSKSDRDSEIAWNVFTAMIPDLYRTKIDIQFELNSKLNMGVTEEQLREIALMVTVGNLDIKLYLDILEKVFDNNIDDCNTFLVQFASCCHSYYLNHIKEENREVLRGKLNRYFYNEECSSYEDAKNKSYKFISAISNAIGNATAKAIQFAWKNHHMF